MTDVLIYWRDYRRNREGQFVDADALRWHSNSQVLGKMTGGDRLWMVTCGASLDQERRNEAFLVGIWSVADVVANPGDDAAYPPERYRYRVLADTAESIVLAEPVPVDDVLRPARWATSVPIGRLLQGPRRLDAGQVRRLRAAAGGQLALQWLVGRVRDHQ